MSFFGFRVSDFGFAVNDRVKKAAQPVTKQTTESRATLRTVACMLTAAWIPCSSSALASTPIPTPRPGVPAVYVDRSHEWLFAYDDLAGRMLAPAGYDVVLCDASLGALADLKDYAVVVMWQAATPSVLSEPECALLREYVAAGGQLLLVTAPKAPAAVLAAEFGFAIEVTAGRAPLTAQPALIQHGSPREVATRRIPFTLKPSPNQTVLVTDAAGTPIAAVRGLGKGRILFWPDNLSYWDFCAQRGPDMRVPTTDTTVALFRFLTGPPTRSKKGRVRRVEAELVGEFGPLVLRYSQPNAAATAALRERMPTIIAEVERWNGRKVSAKGTFTVNFLSSGGGGWAGGTAIGVSAFGDPAYQVKVMAHEMTHTITGPWPWIFNEGWASTVGIRVAETTGFRESAAKEHKRWRSKFEKADPTHDRLDIMRIETAGEKDRAYEGKAMWMIEQLEARFGRNFMARFVAARWQRFGSGKGLDLTQTLDLFSEAAGTDLAEWYRSLGITR